MIITDQTILRLPCVNAKSEDISPIINKLEQELELSAKNGREGIGLAAPQIGIFKNIAIIRLNKDLRVNLINCRISAGYDKEIFDGEGCLSFPDLYAKTMRYQEIYVVENEVYPHSFIAAGLFAVAIQHEIDHLHARLLPDFNLAKESFKKLRPNDICNCGSGKKYKRCHGVENG